MPRTAISDPVAKCNFKVSIPGLSESIGFQKVSGLSRERAVVEYKESGYKYTHKMPGNETVGEVTLERGVFRSQEIYNLYRDSLTNPQFRKTVTVVSLDKDGNSVQRWTLAEAWVSKWEGTDFDAESDDVAVEKLTMQFEYYVD